MAFLPRRLLLEVPTCPLCGADSQACRGHTKDPEHLLSYPFLPGGKDPMAEGKYTLKAEDGDETGRVWNPANGLLVGKAGDEIPLAQAAALGLAEPKVAAEPKPAGAVKKTTRTRPRARSGETR